MSEPDLRPTERGGFKPSSVKTDMGRIRWWEPLTSKWGILCILIAAGLFAGLFERSFNTGSDSKTAPLDASMRASSAVLSAKDRANLDAALHPAINAYYADPSEANQEAAISAIKSFRRSFPDALPITFQASTEKMECAGDECRVRRQQSAERYSGKTQEIYAAFPNLDTSSMEYRANVVEALTRERVLPVDVAVNWINEDKKRFLAEKELDGTRARLFREIDNAAPSEDNINKTALPHLRELLDAYISSSYATFRPVEWRQCPEVPKGIKPRCGGLRVRPDVHAPLPDRIALAKQAITERYSTRPGLQRALGAVFGFP